MPRHLRVHGSGTTHWLSSAHSMTMRGLHRSTEHSVVIARRLDAGGTRKRVKIKRAAVCRLWWRSSGSGGCQCWCRW